MGIPRTPYIAHQRPARLPAPIRSRVTVSTGNTSHATIPSAWAFRNSLPVGGFHCQSLHQHPHPGGHWGSARSAVTGGGPTAGDQPAMPAQDRSRCHQQAHSPRRRRPQRQRRDHHPIRPRQPRAGRPGVAGWRADGVAAGPRPGSQRRIEQVAPARPPDDERSCTPGEGSPGPILPAGPVAELAGQPRSAEFRAPTRWNADAWTTRLADSVGPVQKRRPGPRRGCRPFLGRSRVQMRSELVERHPCQAVISSRP